MTNHISAFAESQPDSSVFESPDDGGLSGPGAILIPPSLSSPSDDRKTPPRTAASLREAGSALGIDVRRGGAVAKSPWPTPNKALIAKIVNEGSTLATLRALSPEKLPDSERHTKMILGELFPGDPLLCLGFRKERFDTKPRSEWFDVSKLPLIVPSAMSSRTGRTQPTRTHPDGKPSKRCLGNTGPRQYLVVEFDHATEDAQACLLLHLNKYAPLVMVLHSGGKSLHGWFDCHGGDSDAHHRFFQYAVSLGADPRTWTPCQLVRLPDGQRDDGTRQRILYWNPAALRGGDWAATSTLPEATQMHEAEEEEEEGESCTEKRSNRETEQLSNGDNHVEGGEEERTSLSEAISKCRPRGPKQNNRALFNLARKVRRVEKERNARFTEDELLGVVAEWCTGHQFLTHSPETYFMEFQNAYDRVKWADGEEGDVAALELARTQPLPTEAELFKDEKIRLLVAWCFQLQKSVGDRAFFISCRKAGGLMGVPFTTMNTWLLGLQRRKVIRLHERGNTTDRANRYFYNSLCPEQQSNVAPKRPIQPVTPAAPVAGGVLSLPRETNMRSNSLLRGPQEQVSVAEMVTTSEHTTWPKSLYVSHFGK
jgi:hypothetical protein